VPPDDLLRQVPLDALGAGVPAQDVPAGVEREDRVVLDAVDEESLQPIGLGRIDAGCAGSR
jgi:hypothetical protein